MTRRSFAEMVERAKGEKFSLPYNVKMHKHLMPNGKWSYVFRHNELGELGRILIVPYGNQSQICSEVAGEPNDPMTKKRVEVFGPISKGVLEKMGMICGKGHGESIPYASPIEKHLVKSTEYPCHICQNITAMLVFADDADDQARLEDYARLMYAKIKEFDVPTWIIGRETENVVNGQDLGKSLVLKAHPKREDSKIMTPDEVMDIINNLMEVHCKRC